MDAVIARYYRLVKGPFRTLQHVCVIGVCISLLAIGLAILWPILWPICAGLVLAWIVLAVVLQVLLTTRLFGRVQDLHASVSLYANVAVKESFRDGLFVDGAAASASLLLFLLKCLTVCKPRAILELGSGQTTKLFAHYFHNNPDARVYSLEHDETWVGMLTPLITKEGKCHEYRHAPLVPRDFVCAGTGNAISTKGYAFPPDCLKQKFNLIVVDGPDTAAGSGYTREGFLEHVPAILAVSFTVVFDDTERRPEMRMANRFERILSALEIAFVRFEIHAVKSQVVFCSRDLAFLRSV